MKARTGCRPASVMSIDVNHFAKKRKEFGMYRVWWASEPEPVGRRRGCPPYAAGRHLTPQAFLSVSLTGFYHEVSASVCCCSKSSAAQVFDSDPPRCESFPNHRNTVGRFCGFFQPFRCATVFLVESVYAESQVFMLNPKSFKLSVEWTFLCFTDVFVGKFCSVVCLNRLNSEWKRFQQHMQKLH